MAVALAVSAADTYRHTARLRIPAQRPLQGPLQRSSNPASRKSSPGSHKSNPGSRKNNPASRKNKLVLTAT
jgi:hypothetical protein